MSDADKARVQPTEGTNSDILVQGGQDSRDVRSKQRGIAFKVSYILLLILFLWIFVVHAVGLLFFTKGFLLSRVVLENQSECSTLPNGDESSTKNGCWHSKKFERAVVVVIDALRYDFTVPFQLSDSQQSPAYYHNNLPFMYNTAAQSPERAILLPFIADPPTSTLQRLKGLTAGNLPTFIDIGSSFAGSATEEDNLLVQLNNTGKKIVHLGDDTWHSLFPGYFDDELTHAYDSFNVWDLDTVDNGVIKHIMPLLQAQSTSNWDIVFAHFLGVDHAGHRYGPDHQAMRNKLQQMNLVIQEIAENIEEDTLLVVMGDHGMDSKGDHGGESDEEVQSTLWMYSKTSKFGRIHPSHVQPPLTAKDRPVEQIDLVSTLSLLLGLPIPFNNLGTPIPEAFIGSGRPDWQNLAIANLLTFDQIQRYMTEYTKSRELHVNKDLLDTVLRFRAIDSSQRDQNWKDLNAAYTQWHSHTTSMFRKLWANFDTTDMLLGVVLSGLGLVSLVLSSLIADSDATNTLPSILRNIGTASVVGAACASLLSSLVPFAGKFSGPLYGSVLFTVLYSMYTYIAKLSLNIVFKPVIWTWLSFIFTVTQAAGFAANSYTIHEDTILLFFLSTFGILAFASSLRQALTSDRILGTYHSALFILLTRLSSYSRLCREEQMPGCRSTFYASQSSSTSAPWQLLIPFSVAIILPELIKAFYKGTASYSGSAGLWIGLSFRIGLFFVAVYWTVDAADNGNWLADTISSSTMKTISVTVARCALAVALPVGIGTFIYSKPCIDISVKPAESLPSSNSQVARPQITLLGYANVFGTRYFLLVPIVVLTTILLLPPMGQFALSILTWQILCLLEILDTNRLTISSTSSSSIGPVVLAMLGSYHFFKTGHQAVLSSIQWPAAFVPFRTLVYPYAPLLVVVNTFGAQIICAVAVPLTVLWKRPTATEGLKGIWSHVMKACLAHLTYYATMQLATTMWAGHLRRHLMLYRVFMPRFLMASGVLLIVDLLLLVISLGAVKITGESVAEIFGY